MRNRISFVLFFGLLCSVFAENKENSEEYSSANIQGNVHSKGEEVPFVNIYLKGTTIGTVTNDQGEYKLKDIPATDQIIVASAIGFKSLEKPINLSEKKMVEIDFELEADLLGLDEVVVTGNRNEEKRTESTVIVNTLNPKLFNITQSVDLKEGLNYCPGLRTENNCGNCGFSQVRMNGMEGPYSQILINSRPIFSGLAGVYGLELIPANMIERVEVIRGGGSALYGSNAIAGTINMILKDPITNTYEITASSGLVGVGVNGSGQPAVDNNINFNTSLVSNDTKSGMAVYGNYRTRDPFDANNDGYSQLVSIDNTTLGTRLFHRFGSRSKIALDFFHINEKRRGGDKFDYPEHVANIAESVSHKITTGALSYDKFFRDEDVLSVYASAQGVDRGSYYGANQSLKDYGHTGDLSHNVGAQYTAKFGQHSLLVGLENKGANLLDKKLGYADFENAIIEDGQIIEVPLTQNTIVSDQLTNTIGTFAQYEIKGTRLSATFGLRYDHYLVRDNIAPDSINGNVVGNVYSPRINIKYDFTKTLQGRVSYSQGYRAPQIFDEDLHIETSGSRKVIHINDPNLTQETSHSFMGSLSYNKNFERTSLSILAEGFYTQLNDPFVNEHTDPDENGVVISLRTNAGSASVQGVNLEANFVTGPKLSLNGGLTLQTSYYDEPQEDFNESRFLRTPNTYGFLTVDWRPTRNLSFSLTGNYTGPMLVPHFGLDPNTTDPNELEAIKNGDVIAGQKLITSQSFYDLGAAVRYTIDINEAQIQFFGGIKNMLNSYQSDFDRGIYRDPGYVYGPGSPRSFQVGIKLGNNLR